MRLNILMCLFTFFATSVLAQDLQFDESATRACIANMPAAESIAQCAGVSAQSCINATADGYTTVGMGYCFEQERLFWDARLNTTYREALQRAQTIDKEMAAIGSSAPPQEEALRKMQRAWITFRDAACEYEYSQWGGGTGGGPAYVSCLMSLTADQTSRLARWLEG